MVKMNKLKTYPKNKNKFIRLKRFCRIIIGLCDDLGIKPIAYGSLVYFVYLKNKNIKVNDIDLLVSEEDLEKLAKVLKQEKIKHRYLKKWHTIQIFQKDLKIELDSYQFWSIKLSHSEYFDFGDFKLKIVSLRNLINIYKWASQNSKDKPEEYRKKYKALSKWVNK